MSVRVRRAAQWEDGLRLLAMQRGNSAQHECMILDPSGRPTCMSFEAAQRDSAQMAEEMAGAAKPLRLGKGSEWARVEVRPEAAKEDEEEEGEEDEEEDADE